MLVLASPYVGHMPNPSRLVFGAPEEDDEREIWKVRMELRSAQASDVTYCHVLIVIRNGTCTMVARQTVPPIGLLATNPDRYFIVSTREVATGYTDLKTAVYNAANNTNARRVAWENHLRSAGHIDASLA